MTRRKQSSGEIGNFLAFNGVLSTSVRLIDWACKLRGRFIIVGKIPGTCYNHDEQRSKDYATEEEAIAAILADWWIQANPKHVVQKANCGIVKRPADESRDRFQKSAKPE